MSHPASTKGTDYLLSMYGDRLADVKDAADLQKEIEQILEHDEGYAHDEAVKSAARFAEELWRAK